MRASAIAVVCLSALGLTACVEVDGMLEIKPDGSAVNRTELRVDKEFATMIDQQARAEKARLAKSKKKADPATESSKSFAEHCQDLTTPPKPQPGAAPWPVVPTTAAVTKRGGKIVCTLIETIANPSEHYTKVAAAIGVGSEFATFAPIGDGTGYRYVSDIRLNQLASSVQDADVKSALALVKPMLAELRTTLPDTMRLTFTMKSARIGDTDGRINDEGRAVTWSFPFVDLLDLGPDAKPIKSRADVYFR